MFYLEDLARSRVEAADMDIRPLALPERSALDLHHNIQGYVIPYFDINGNPTSYYRARLQDTTTKYKQPKGSQNAIYFPKNFLESINGHKYVIITEGEKKAAKAVKQGFPCVGLGGVYSWRCKEAKLPAENLVVKSGKGGAVDVGVEAKQNFRIKLEGLDIDRMLTEYADGFLDLVSLIKARQLTVLIIFDSEYKHRQHNGVSLDVQRAAARLGLEFRYQGVPLYRIKQAVLPLGNHEKMGVDDFLFHYDEDRFESLIDEVVQDPRAFPAHPMIDQHIAQKLQFNKNTRKDLHQLGLAMISDLDIRGKRLRTIPNDDLFYFDDDSKTLVGINNAALRSGGPSSGGAVFNEFQSLLYRRYGITGYDGRFLQVVTTQIGAEQPINEVKPRKGNFSVADTIHHLINPRQYITISADNAIQLHDNGDNSVMYNSSSVEDTIDGTQLVSEVERQLLQPVKPWWFSTLTQTRIKDEPNNRKKKLATLLFYTSPWLFRWRGTQLPVELTTGEAGSGKSTLYDMRLRILTGRADLRNRPQSLKDWHASVLESSGLHVIDNANLDADPSLGQSISDEMCRMVTEPEPTVEMRRYYTEHELIRVPAHVVFAMTSIKLPFRQVDLMQRAFHIHLERSLDASGYEFDADWANTQLAERGGRIGWLAHHIVVLHRFLQLVQEKWKSSYKARYRLINFEQIMMLMAEAVGWDPSWIPEELASATKQTTVDGDLGLQGLKAFADGIRTQNKHTSSLIRVPVVKFINWVEAHEEFSRCKVINNLNSLNSYFSSSKAMINGVAGMTLQGAILVISAKAP